MIARLFFNFLYIFVWFFRHIFVLISDVNPELQRFILSMMTPDPSLRPTVDQLLQQPVMKKVYKRIGFQRLQNIINVYTYGQTPNGTVYTIALWESYQWDIMMSRARSL